MKCCKTVAFFVMALAMYVRPAQAGARSATADATCSPHPDVQRLIERALMSGGTREIRRPKAFQCLSFPSNVPVTIVRKWKDPIYRATYFRLHCVPSSSCLPFLVTVPDDLELRGPDGEAGHERHLANISADGRGPNTLIPRQALGLAEVTPGQVITLIWEQNGMRLSRKVVCLDRGARGEQVRARLQGSSQIIKGRVIGPGIVEILS